MTTIKIFKADGVITGFSVSGHTGFAESGKDILCASVSTLVGACHLGLQKVLNLHPNFKIDEKNGLFDLQLDEVSANQPCVQTLLRTFNFSAEELALNHKKFIKIQIKGD